MSTSTGQLPSSDYGPDEAATDNSPFRLLNAAVSSWRVLVCIPLIAAIFTAAVALLGGANYTATASFIPQADQSTQSQLSSLAAQFGVSVAQGSNVGQSPLFYRTLLRSDEIARRVATDPFRVVVRGRPVERKLSSLLGTDESTANETMQRTVEALHERVQVTVDRDAGVVEISAATPWPHVSVEIVSRLLQLANEFNLRKRQERAAAEQAFIQGRLDVAAAELRAAEDELQAFLQRNRQYEGDPHLLFAFDRLQRNVQMRQGVYTTLAQGFEQASLNAVRDTPMITTVEQPYVGPYPDHRGVVAKSLLALVLGLIVAIGYVVARDFAQSIARRFPSGFEQFQAGLSIARMQLVRLFRKRSVHV